MRALPEIAALGFGVAIGLGALASCSNDATITVATRSSVGIQPGVTPLPGSPPLDPTARLVATVDAVKVHVAAMGEGQAPADVDGDVDEHPGPPLDAGMARDAGHDQDVDTDEGSGADHDGDTDEGAGGGDGWVSLISTPQTIDLLDTAATTTYLGTTAVPPGRITQIRLVLAGDLQFVVGGSTTTIACPSCTTSGLKVVPRGTLVVDPGASLSLVLDVTGSLDLAHARLDPVVVVGDVH